MDSIQAGTVHPVEILISDPTGEPITGLSSGDIVCNIRCTTPGGADLDKQWDFGGVTPQLRSTGWTTRLAPLVEISASLAPGYYRVAAGWPTTGLTGSFVMTYDMTVAVDTTSVPAYDDVMVLAAGGSAASTSDVTDARDIITAAVAVLGGVGFTAGTDDLHAARARLNTTATATNVTDARDHVEGHVDTVAAALPGTINTALGGTHGTGSWATATGFATPTNVTDAVSAVEAYGQLHWITATGFSTPTNVTDAVAAIEAYGQLHWTTAIVAGLSTLAVGDIAPAVWNALTASHVTANSFGALIKLNVNATITSRMATFTYSAPPSAQDISTLVNADIETAHGAGAYTATDVSLLATTTQLNSALSTISTAITAVPAAVWTRALPGSHLTGSAGALLALAGALAPPTATTIAEAMRDLPEGTPTTGSYGYAWQLGRMLITNALIETAGNPGTAVLYKDNGTAAHLTWALRDKDGTAVTGTTGEPARRGAAT